MGEQDPSAARKRLRSRSLAARPDHRVEGAGCGQAGGIRQAAGHHVPGGGRVGRRKGPARGGSSVIGSRRSSLEEEKGRIMRTGFLWYFGFVKDSKPPEDQCASPRYSTSCSPCKVPSCGRCSSASTTSSSWWPSATGC